MIKYALHESKILKMYKIKYAIKIIHSINKNYTHRIKQ